MLSVKNIVVEINNTRLFQSNEIQLNKGLIALVGRNGAGKSTLLKCIMGQHLLSSGSIELYDESITKMSIQKKAKLISVVFSKASIFGNHTAFDVLKLGRIPYQSIWANLQSDDTAIIEKVIDQMSLKALLQKEFNKLSDGEKQLIMIGRSLIQDTPIILLDEPAAFLDVVNQYELMQVLHNISKDSNKLIIYSTHQVENIDNNCQGLLMIENQFLSFNQTKGTFKQSIQKAFGIA